MKKTIIIFLIFYSHLLFAAGSGSGKIQQIIAHNSSNGNGVVMFKTASNSNKAACSTTDSGTQWAFSLGDEQGKAMYSLLLMAYAANKSVVVQGAGDCSAWGDRERPYYILVN